MKMKRRTFLSGMAAAATVTALPRPCVATPAAGSAVPVATLIDLSRCDGCRDAQMPRCVSACREKNADRFPEPDPSMLKDYWP
ncbi:MAG: 4Fe-4S ferredoxin, partial [Desulfuromonadales bacterium]|nr:4Fe-4S ferredoxin [Desulfuromonadales bacterium]NIR33680.1 4Fe-4S ferredoxin [Desulfuromonadales bacterium]NIS44002.1 4Fe-4S ferredoxin [Desulfuromonadales bacterium]